MKSNRKILLANAPLLLLALVISVSGCRKEPLPTPQTQPMTFVSSVLSKAQTKYIGGNEFHSGDQISLYALAWTSETAPLFTDLTKAHVSNALYTRDDYYFVYSGSGNVGFPANGSKLDFYAIYPYSAAAPVDPASYEFKTQTDQSSTEKQLTNDLLIAKRGGIAPQLQPIQLEFQHAMAKFQVAVCKNADYPANINIADIKFKVGTTAKVNLPTQVAILSKPTETEYVSPTNVKDTDTDTLRGAAILAPQIIANTYASIEVKMSNNKIHYYTFPADFNLDGNTITKLRLSLSYGSANAVKISTTITNWGTGAVISVDDIPQQSENTFSCTVLRGEDQLTADQAKFAKITTQITGQGERTFTVPATYDATNKQWLFEFRGVGNRPNSYPFTVKSVYMLKVDYSVHATMANINQEVTQPEHINLTYPVVDLDYTIKPANCYITYPGKTFVFDARKKAVAIGGAATNVVSSDVPSTDIAPTSIKVVWQTTANHGSGITAPTAADMIIQQIAFDKVTGTCTITPHATGTGNALVAAYDADGTTILWSWHIWVTNGEVKGNVDPGNLVNGIDKRFMDRNLGALAATTAQPSAADAYKYFGLLWQWGRKEPFTGQGAGEVANTYIKIYKADATAYPDELGGFILNTGAAPTMATCIENPTAYYFADENAVIIGNPNTWSDNPAAKAMYDPCPYGYRVPKDGSWEGLTANEWEINDFTGGTVWQSTWWPAAGYLEYRNANLAYVGSQARYWSSSPSVGNYGAYNAYNLKFAYDKAFLKTSGESNRSSGFPIRCVQE